MKKKQCKLKNVDSIKKYLALFSGLFQLTDSEINVLSEMIRYRIRGLYHKTPADPTSSDAKKVIAERLGLSSPYSVNTYLQRLREKKAILNKNTIHPWLMPQGEKVLEIHLDWKVNLLE